MKKHILFLFLILLLGTALLLQACGTPSAPSGETAPTADAQIAELMRQLDALRESEREQDEEYRLLMQELQAALEALAATSAPIETPNDSTDTGTQAPEDTTGGAGRFTYVTNGVYATITGFTGEEESLVIPSQIDGYIVTAIGERAFFSPSLKQVTVSPGIVSLDWFAFYGCSSLKSVALPASVTEIGYGAFDGCAKGLTVSCPADSYAMAYAKSYGLSVFAT